MRSFLATNNWRRLLAAAARPRRRGSILIMVVAVLVLLALMGTAYISTARLDRQAAGPANDATAEEVIEYLIPSIGDMVRDAIARDVASAAFGYRTPADTTYDNWDYAAPTWIGTTPNTLALLNDHFLASRVPEYVPVQNMAPLTDVPAWLSLTRPLNQPEGVPTPQPMKRFETPYAQLLTTAQKVGVLEHYPEWTQDQNTSSPAQRIFMVPTDLTIAYPTNHPDPALANRTRVFPAFMAYKADGGAGSQNVMTDPTTGRAMKFLAADADGDGVADAGLVYLTTVAGVRYYYATRVVDNNSAINVNTARSIRGDFSGTSFTVDRPPTFVFPSSVGLLELLLEAPDNSFSTTSNEMDALNRYMWNIPAGPVLPPLTPVQDAINPVAADDPTPTGRTDFTYNTQGEATYFQSHRRLGYPGFRVPGAAPTGGVADARAYNPFVVDLNLSLMYRFGMMDPSSTTPPVGSVDYVLDLLNLNDPVYRAAPNYADGSTPASLAARFRYLPPSEWRYWFHYSYNFDEQYATTSDRDDYFVTIGAPLPKLPLRSLLTTWNPVSNRTVGQAQAINSAMLPYGNKGRWHDQQPYVAGDICYHAPTGMPALNGAQRTYLYLATAASGPSTTPPQTGAALAAGWARVRPRGIWNAGAAPAYAIGDIVHHTAPGTVGTPTWGLYVCVAAPGATVPAPGMTTPWRELSGYAAPAKASLNTGTFEELFRAFFNVMTEGNTAGPPLAFIADQTAWTAAAPAYVTGNTTPPTIIDPYVGNRFHDQVAPAPTATYATRFPFDPIVNDDPQAAMLPAGAATGTDHPMKMFRSPIRSLPNAVAPHYDAGMRRLTPQSVMELRSALAAVNAIDARDADLNVTSRKLQLYAVQGAGAAIPADFMPVEVTVYGHEAQPFITEVYANTDTTTPSGATVNPQGYVAIELYNPYPFDIPLTEYRLAVINRLGFGMGGAEAAQPQDLPVRELVNFSDPAVGTPVTPVVPARGYLLLENYDATGTSTDPQRAMYRPASTGLPAVGPLIGAQPGNAPAPGAPTAPPQLNVSYLRLPNGAVLPQNPPATIFNQEMVLLKRRNFDGTPTAVPAGDAAEPGVGPVNENVANPDYLRDMIPVDSFDFTGLVLPGVGHLAPTGGAAVTEAQAWHYMRASNEDAAGPFPTKAWHFVYPGRYDATNTVATPATPWNLAPRPRQAGTRYSLPWDPATERDEWDRDNLAANPNPSPNPSGLASRPTGPEMTMGATYPVSAVRTTNASSLATYHTTFPTQLGFGNFHDVATLAPGGSVGHNPTLGAGPHQFPYGGFSRNGDVLHVPFIGAYVITRAPGSGGAYPAANPAMPAGYLGGSSYVVEMNSVTMDAAMAEDSDPGDDPQYTGPAAPPEGSPIEAGLPAQPFEQLGRFFPGVRLPGPAVLFPAGGLPSYAWAGDVLDHFTAVQNFHDDFMPNVDPARYPAANPPPRGIANVKGALANTAQDADAGANGLINVNTASWKVLAALPLVVDTGANVQTGDAGVPGAGPLNLNEALARAIVHFRDVDDGTGQPHGPFKSLFELNAVVDTRPGGMGTTAGFQNMMGQLPLGAASADPDDAQGDFSPAGSPAAPFTAAPYTSDGVATGRQPTGTDGVRFDYEEKNLNLIRLSNLLTTRSDTFTCYVVVQGWTNTGSTTPQLVAERRAAFTVDRSTMSTTNGAPSSKDIPTK